MPEPLRNIHNWERHHMSANQPDFAGPFEAALTHLAAAIDQVWADHGTSFVKAGDDKVYALGGAGYIVVFDENRWGGLVEVLTPKVTISIRPVPGQSSLSVTAPDTDEAKLNQLLEETAESIGGYYGKRYWRTPKIA
jgi:hypothetical protein